MKKDELSKIIEKAVLEKATKLELIGNKLRELSTDIGKLTNITLLDLSGNKLRKLPTEVGLLKNLRKLLLHGNELMELPIEIGKLKNLTTLDLSGNCLREVPTGIWQLKNLTNLELYGNELSELPAEISKLTNLTRLDLGGNHLCELPPEIGQLTCLSSLDLEGNQLSQLPSEIGHLINLARLDLRGHKLRKLPSGICKMKNLRWLDVSDNQLTTLPMDIWRLTNLTWLDVGNNPITTPPIEVVKEGVDSIKNFFKQLLEKDKDYIFEAKLVLVGEAGAGKTTLAKKIKNHNYQLKEEVSTKGIDIIRWKFEIDNKREFHVNIWDFGGQEIYHSTHQFFLTKRSLYLLVADTRKEDTDFYYWCNIVSLLSDNSPLLIIKNEKQDRFRQINERQLREQFLNLKETISTNLATNRGLKGIISKIQHYIGELPHIGMALPKTWTNVRLELERMIQQNYISFEEYLKICDKFGFSKRKDKLQLSAFLHDLGVCLHFQDDPVLKNTLIINPEWGTDAVYKVLDNDKVVSNLGKFTKFDLEKIWSEDSYANMHDELLHLMIKFRLCYKIPGKNKDYIAPQLLTVNKPKYDWDENKNLHLRYTYRFMPKGIIIRFIVAMHKWIDEQRYVWRSGVIIKKDRTKAEIIENYDSREIKIRVSGQNMKELLIIVTHELDRINDSFYQLKYDKLIPCNCSDCRETEPYFYKHKDLKRRLSKGRLLVECDKSYKMIRVRELLEEVTDIEVLGKKESKKVFVSYSHKDNEMLQRVKTHLKVLEHEGVKIDLWEDTQIRAGNKWLIDIEKALSLTKVAILLISTDFLASDFIQNKELPYLLDIAKRDGAKILPLILKPCRYNKNKELSSFQAINDPNEALSKLSEAQQDEILLRLVDSVDGWINEDVVTCPTKTNSDFRI